MSLYDDLDTLRQKSDEVAGWSSGIKLFQSQLQVKKAASSTKRDGMKKVTSVLAPVFDLNSKKDEDGEDDIKDIFGGYGDDMDWNFSGEEYDPLWPNDYEKVVKDLRELREKEKEREDEERQKKREERRVRESRFEPLTESSGAVPPPDATTPPLVDEENEEKPLTPRGGAAIAPPPSLMEQVIPKAYGASVAAKIMAKYGFKEGQGLGKKEQGISMALQVEKTSKRGGRIVHEKDIMPPPPVMPPPGPLLTNPPIVAPLSPPRPNSPKQTQQQQQASITEIMKAPSKVVLLKNMVGPGEVDDDLEPEVKDECNTKYGEVIRVIIYELPNAESEEAVRIFVEFRRIESAIKAVVDLNGRFFGGRQVKAGFYPWEKLENLELLD